MKPAEKVRRSWIRSLPTNVRNVNIFNEDGILTRDRLQRSLFKPLAAQPSFFTKRGSAITYRYKTIIGWEWTWQGTGSPEF
jgi:hypothetical protein